MKVTIFETDSPDFGIKREWFRVPEGAYEYVVEGEEYALHTDRDGSTCFVDADGNEVCPQASADLRWIKLVRP